MRAYGVVNPDLLDANEWTWVFVTVYGVGCEGNPLTRRLGALASDDPCQSYCGLIADAGDSREPESRDR